jgi:hypothetical protein
MDESINREEIQYVREVDEASYRLSDEITRFRLGEVGYVGGVYCTRIVSGSNEITQLTSLYLLRGESFKDESDL